MNARKFFNKVTNSSFDILYEFLKILEKEKISYCVIGGFAINAYCEPLLTLDFDCVVDEKRIEDLKKSLKVKGFKIKAHPHAFEIRHPESDLRIQIQRDKRFQDFIKRAKTKNVLGYKMKVASREDLLLSKIWSIKDRTRSELKREKDKLDIKRLLERFPELKGLIEI